jgi:UDP-N-acetylglucosamine 2-epimerase (non-hydrolysing)
MKAEMPSILFIVGTRPEAIKLCPLLKEMRSKLNKSRVSLCSTGQHRQMLDQVLDFFGESPDFELSIMDSGQTLFGVMAKAIAGMEGVCSRSKPDYVVVQGDTTSALAGALAGFYCGARVVHIEAGLRTGDLRQPFPEEGNRQLVSRLASYHFAPTETAKENLAREGIVRGVHVVGNTVVDALLWAATRAKLPQDLAGIIAAEKEQGKKIVLVTGHRRESFGEPFEAICGAIGDLACRPDTAVIYPLHLNPRVREPVLRILARRQGVHLIEPVDYPTMVGLLKECHVVLTDSGGIQEEAPSLGKPVLVMRQVTERPEGIVAGTSRLVGTDRKKIVESVGALLDDPLEYRRMVMTRNPYGDGHSSERIVSVLMDDDSDLR